MTTAHYTALPLATLTLTAHTRPARPSSAPRKDNRDAERAEPDSAR
jgi:hypothetical protein